ncbi:MAG: T9SS type A sorting domain-containing protein [Saprospiraceae bacterium]|nr:T9SS type A sorting domain-containing protein [Saprospiraceae bacterium]
MKNKPFLYLLPIFLAFQTLAQPNLSNQFCYGGSQIETGSWAELLPNGSRIFGGITNSNNGDVNGLHNNSADAWVVKTNADGVLEFQRCIGGSDFDLAIAGSISPEGGIVAAGQTYSNDGDFIGQNKGACDAFIAKVAPNGNLVWAKLLGGAQCDLFEAVWPIASGGYLTGGETASNDGDISNFLGGVSDMFLARFDENGNQVWKKTYGGTGMDRCLDLWKTIDGQFIVLGETNSTDGHFPATHGQNDVVLMKIDLNGDILWTKTFGGNSFDRGVTVRQKTNGEYVVLAGTQSTSGQVSGFQGFRDIWVFRTDANGNLLSQRCLGGTQADDPGGLEIAPNGDILVAGSSRSTDGDLASDPGSAAGNGWLVLLNANLDIRWAATFGTANGTQLFYAAPTITGGAFAIGVSEGIAGDVTCSKGSQDIWAFDLAPSVGAVEIEAQPAFKLSPNPASTQLSILAGKETIEAFNVLIINVLGQIALETNGTLEQINSTLSQKVGHFPKGQYVLQLRTEERTEVLPFLKY